MEDRARKVWREKGPTEDEAIEQKSDKGKERQDARL